MQGRIKLVNACPVFVSKDVSRTVDYYVKELGFSSAKHYDHIESFAAVYRDSIEFIIIQAKRGEIESNRIKYGTGYDAYIDPDTVEGVDLLYQEFAAKNVKVVSKPKRTAYGAYEFVIEDIDGRLLGIGRICDERAFFADSDYVPINTD